jgi:hypothetical protein
MSKMSKTSKTSKTRKMSKMIALYKLLLLLNESSFRKQDLLKLPKLVFSKAGGLDSRDQSRSRFLDLLRSTFETGGYAYCIYISMFVYSRYLCGGTLVPWYIMLYPVALNSYCLLRQHVRANKASLQTISVSSLTSTPPPTSSTSTQKSDRDQVKTNRDPGLVFS